MAIKVKNDGARAVGVNTPGGIQTVKPGKTGEFDEVINLEALKGAKGVKVTGDKKEEDNASKPASTDPKSTGGKATQAGQSGASAATGAKAS